MSADIKKTPHHGEPKHQDSPTHASAGYEKLDAQAGATYRAGFYILGTMFLVALVLVPAFRYLARQESRAQRPSAFVVRDAAKPPEGAFPRLVTSEPAVLSEYRKKEDEVLTGWGWVEKDHGIARMPVAEAMKIVGERGALPAFPAVVAAGGAGAPSAPATASPAGAGAAPKAAPIVGASGAAKPGSGGRR